MPTTKEDLQEAFAGKSQANQKNLVYVKTSCAQTGFQTPKTSNNYYINETIIIFLNN
jgi:hypothetical protein